MVHPCLMHLLQEQSYQLAFKLAIACCKCGFDCSNHSSLESPALLSVCWLPSPFGMTHPHSASKAFNQARCALNASTSCPQCLRTVSSAICADIVPRSARAYFVRHSERACERTERSSIHIDRRLGVMEKHCFKCCSCVGEVTCEKLVQCWGLELLRTIEAAAECPELDRTQDQQLLLQAGKTTVAARNAAMCCAFAEDGKRYFHQQCLVGQSGRQGEGRFTVQR